MFTKFFIKNSKGDKIKKNEATVSHPNPIFGFIILINFFLFLQVKK